MKTKSEEVRCQWEKDLVMIDRRIFHAVIHLMFRYHQFDVYCGFELSCMGFFFSFILSQYPFELVSRFIPHIMVVVVVVDRLGATARPGHVPTTTPLSNHNPPFILVCDV